MKSAMENTKVNYKKVSACYFIGNLFNKGIVFLTVPIFTRILSTYDYGIVNTYNSWVTILAMILGFAMHTGIRLAYVDYREEFEEFTATTIFFTVGSSIVITAIVVILIIIFKLNVSIALVILCLVQALSMAILQDYNYYLMMKYKYKFRTIIMVLPNLISVILSIFIIKFVLQSNLYMGRILANVLVNVIFGIFVLVLIFNKNRIVLKKKYLIYGLSISAPLIIHGIALNILSQSDRMMITWLADASQTGIYSLIYNFSMIATVITASLEGVWFPWFLQKIKERKIDDINKMAKYYIKLITCAIICLILVSPEIIKILADEAYWEGIIIIPPIILANYVIFIYSLYVNIEHYHKKTKYITINTVISAVINIILNFLYIPKYGYKAAAYTTLISYIITLVLHSKYAKKLEPDMYPLTIFINSTINIVLSIGVFYLFINNTYLRWGGMGTFLICVLINERELVLKNLCNSKFKRKTMKNL